MLSTSSLTRTTTLWGLFAATLVLTGLFPVTAAYFDITLVDGISSPQKVREVIDGFSQDQRLAHAWITGTLDVAYPLAYGLLFAAVAVRFFPRTGQYLALAPLLCIPVDLIEGVVQVAALVNLADWVQLKAFITPLKTLLFLFGLATALFAWGQWAYLRLRSQSTSE